MSNRSNPQAPAVAPDWWFGEPPTRQGRKALWALTPQDRCAARVQSYELHEQAQSRMSVEDCWAQAIAQVRTGDDVSTTQQPDPYTGLWITPDPASPRVPLVLEVSALPRLIEPAPLTDPALAA